MTGRKLRVVKHPRDSFFDGATIETVERWKESYLSGDEWRFSYVVKLFRKGKVVACRGANTMEVAAIEMARAIQIDLPSLGVAYGWEVIPFKEIPSDGYCCQPGCSSKATGTYVMKKLFDRTCSFSKPNESRSPGDLLECREFCDKHRERGDCGLDDVDDNYVSVELESQNALTGVECAKEDSGKA